MKKEKLIAINSILDQMGPFGELLSQRRGLYIYYNEPTAKTRQIVIHKHTCGNCAFGSGKQTSAEAGRNGVWIGPFSTTIQVNSHIKKFNLTDVEVKKCTCTKQ